MRKSDLLKRLSAYSTTDEREAGYRRRMLELLRAPDPFARSHFTPGHFTASAIVLSPERDAALLIYHRKLLLWLQPGGHVDPDDASILASARREVFEEVGIANLELAEYEILDLDVHPVPGFESEPAHEHFDVRFSFLAPSRELRQGAEVAGARWVPLTEMQQVTRDVSVLRAIEKVQTRQWAAQ